MSTQDRFRALAHTMPPIDFGSTRAIQAAAKLADELAAGTAAERDRLRAEKAELVAALKELMRDDDTPGEFSIAMDHAEALLVKVTAREGGE